MGQINWSDRSVPRYQIPHGVETKWYLLPHRKRVAVLNPGYSSHVQAPLRMTTPPYFAQVSVPTHWSSRHAPIRIPMATGMYRARKWGISFLGSSRQKLDTAGYSLKPVIPDATTFHATHSNEIHGNNATFFTLHTGAITPFLNHLKTKRNLLYIRNQSVPRCKHFPPRL